jgi:hypothetical protein
MPYCEKLGNPGHMPLQLGCQKSWMQTLPTPLAFRHNLVHLSTHNTQYALTSQPLGKFRCQPGLSDFALQIVVHRPGYDIRCTVCRERHAALRSQGHQGNDPYYAHTERGRRLRRSKKDWFEKLREEIRCQTMNADLKIMLLWSPSAYALPGKN